MYIIPSGARRIMNAKLMPGNINDVKLITLYVNVEPRNEINYTLRSNQLTGL